MSSMSVYLQGRRLQLHPSQAIGKGGEADIFRLDGDRALKLFKPPDHPDYQGQPQAQQAAEHRLAEHQNKLRQFPAGLPARVVQPCDLVTDRAGQTVLGYTMPLIEKAAILWRYSDRGFHDRGLAQASVVEIFQDLHATVTQLHAAGVVIGDCNDLNILVKDTAAYCIDADSYQFAGFLCRTFTTTFVDPLRCDRQAVPLALTQAHNQDSDWYAFAVLLMQSLLCVGPYGGVHKPADPSRKVSQAARPHQRLTVFAPAVQYPKPALPYAILPDELLHDFYRIFVEDQRGRFPAARLDGLHWQTCPRCQLEFARDRCPACQAATVTPVQPPTPTVAVRGSVTATLVYRTEGAIAAASLTEAQLHWLAWQDGKFYREDGRLVFSGDLAPQQEFILHGATTIVCQQGQAIALAPERAPERLAVDTCGNQPQIASNGRRRVWLHRGQLWRDGRLGPEYVGNVLAQQTRIWLGPRCGFGFYRAGQLSVAFVFDPQRAGLNDRVPLALGNGQLLAANCAFSGDRCWFFAQVATAAGRRCQVAVLDGRGNVLAQQVCDPAQTPWLASLSGKCAVGNYLLAATDEGIVRVELRSGQFAVVQAFPDTEPFVDSRSQLLASPTGLYAVGRQQIYYLQLAP